MMTTPPVLLVLRDGAGAPPSLASLRGWHRLVQGMAEGPGTLSRRRRPGTLSQVLWKPGCVHAELTRPERWEPGTSAEDRQPCPPRFRRVRGGPRVRRACPGGRPSRARPPARAPGGEAKVRGGLGAAARARGRSRAAGPALARRRASLPVSPALPALRQLPARPLSRGSLAQPVPWRPSASTWRRGTPRWRGPPSCCSACSTSGAARWASTGEARGRAAFPGPSGGSGRAPCPFLPGPSGAGVRGARPAVPEPRGPRPSARWQPRCRRTVGGRRARRVPAPPRRLPTVCQLSGCVLVLPSHRHRER